VLFGQEIGRTAILQTNGRTLMMRTIDSSFAPGFRMGLLVTVALLATVPLLHAQTASKTTATPAAGGDLGKTLFAQNCAFCHGRDAGGGESGPDPQIPIWWPAM
jgi:mono/diheme cytochrome c family protein